MVKALSVIFGISIAVVIFILFLLGIQAFYPAPEYNDFCNETHYYEPYEEFMKCPDNMTVGECRASFTLSQSEMEKCNKAFEEADKVYGKNFFIIASTLGTALMIAAFFLLSIVNISAGVACAGIVLVIWAFMRGWTGVNDKLKFVVGLIITAIVIGLTIAVNKKISGKDSSKKKR